MALGPRGFPGLSSASRPKHHAGSGPLSSNVRPQMPAPLAVLDRVLQILSWLLWLLWGALLAGAAATAFLVDEQLGEVPGFMWAVGALALSNTLASIVGAICVLFTRKVQEARAIWLLGFLFALLTWSNVALVPLFRHYALRQPRSPGASLTQSSS